jgi:hypothetical protein
MKAVFKFVRSLEEMFENKIIETRQDLVNNILGAVLLSAGGRGLL